jgi:hypothetical protein
MNILFILFFFVNGGRGEKIIRNSNIPSCRNCKYYKPAYYSSDFVSTINKCEKTGTKDIYTDIIKYDYADLSRKDENLCGFKGRYFEQEKNMNLKMLKFLVVKNIPVLIILFISWSIITISNNIYT